MNCPTCQAENEAAAAACARCGATLAQPTTFVVSVDLSPGTLFHARYEILGPLGRGGMGMVYKARDRTLDEVVAIKVLRPDFAQDPKMAERFKTEIKLARRVRHRNVCAIHDYGEDRGLLYISMELIEGVDLKHTLRQQGGLPAEKAYDVAIQVAEGLQAVHDAGIIHRDLKSPNIMLDARGIARLMDFGIAKREGGEGTTLTGTGNIVGTPEYMSPEQAQGRKLDSRSDLYALGIVVYEIFTGQVPFRGETPISTILKHLHDPPPLDGPAAQALSPALRAVLRKALAKEPDGRYASARDFAEALREARAPSRRQQPIATSVLTAPTLRPAPAPTRSGARAWLLALPLVALGVVAAVLLRPGAGPGPAPVASTASSPLATPTSTLAATTTAPVEAGGVAAPAAAAPAEPPPTTLATVPATPRPRTLTATPAPAARRTPPPSDSAADRPAVEAPPAAPRASPSAAPTAPASPSAAAGAPPQGPLGGLLQIAVRPWGEVAVDGRVVGTTPLDKIALPAGAHRVRVRHPAWEALERGVTIQPGETTRLVVDLAVEGVKKP